MKKRVLVVDLDGTLFTINTFHYFIKYLIIYSIKNFKFILLFKLCLAIASRLFATHAKMKYFILKLLKNRVDIDYENFITTIAVKKRYIPEVYDKNFDIKILATGAPSCYANVIAKNEQFNICLGTDFPNSTFDPLFENMKAVKKENVMNCLKVENINEIDTLITDHIDDLPLIKLAKRNIIVEPNEELISILKQNSIFFEVIP
ncbi:hypothetical protein A8C32_00435 [Flavivirga aquatica]|uniref:Haloacid dehalogenase-like hydrolase n=1 Tax=Flavivirga aquatica TaxID=1849968 RepID=A0A1E5TBQ0_9FLAO|nr:HAD family hydrolase [Flavivirga aquatica]OEK08779.1 hypothetical protein A8C32_00435 [Flavivirga aquatica]